jgi:hypothetical protein
MSDAIAAGIVDAALQRERLDGSAATMRSYRDRPSDFVREILGKRYWAGQRYVIESVYKYRRVSHRACRKCGKTEGASGLVLHFGSTGPCTILTTAPTWAQVEDVLWPKIRAAFAGAVRPLEGRMLTTAWRVQPDWFAIGASTDRPENFLGFHAGVEVPSEDALIDAIPPDPLAERPDVTGALHVDLPEIAARATHKGGRLLVVKDEAIGVDPMLYEVLEGSLSGPNAYALDQANPLLDANSPHPFAAAHREGSAWHRIHTSMFTPEPGEDEVGADKHFYGVPAWIMDDPEWARARLKEWGRESSAFRAHVGGMFGRGGMDSSLVITRTLLEVAEARAGTSEQGRHLGVDVALEGDECVAALLVDGVPSAQHVWRSPDLMATADLIVTLAKRWDVPATNVHVDVIGLGAGVVSRLAQMGYRVDGVDFGAAPKGDWSHLFGETKPRNRRAELHWVARRVMEEGLGHVPKRWSDMWAQAMWATFEIRAEGGSGSTLVIEPKADIRARYGRSPDQWDAFLLAWSRSGRAPTPRVIRRR